MRKAPRWSVRNPSRPARMQPAGAPSALWESLERPFLRLVDEPFADRLTRFFEVPPSTNRAKTTDFVARKRGRSSTIQIGCNCPDASPNSSYQQIGYPSNEPTIRLRPAYWKRENCQNLGSAENQNLGVRALEGSLDRIHQQVPAEWLYE